LIVVRYLVNQIRVDLFNEIKALRAEVTLLRGGEEHT
jgi:hypothetical protein